MTMPAALYPRRDMPSAPRYPALYSGAPAIRGSRRLPPRRPPTLPRAARRLRAAWLAQRARLALLAEHIAACCERALELYRSAPRSTSDSSCSGHAADSPALSLRRRRRLPPPRCRRPSPALFAAAARAAGRPRPPRSSATTRRRSTEAEAAACVKAGLDFAAATRAAATDADALARLEAAFASRAAAAVKPNTCAASRPCGPRPRLNNANAPLNSSATFAITSPTIQNRHRDEKSAAVAEAELKLKALEKEHLARMEAASRRNTARACRRPR